ncbi:MAG TPA: LacI family DNA-binding transcriptional regulator [Tepidisphaeraceae bacterium]|jgi:LacI family transcriptional regulator|nr:LacI family DNA-binding transcriptional regulator [Tepidisphaeraceae bacterium]
MSIVDVAKRAGVSVATVSRVINDFPGVSARTAKQVKAAMKELLYVPNVIRPGPKPGSRRTPKGKVGVGSIVVLTVGQTSRDWLTLPMMASMFAGITAAAAERGVRLMVDEMPKAERASDLIAKRQVDGAIVFWSSHLGAGNFELLRGHGVPMVRLMGAIDGPAEVDHVTTDNMAVGRLAHQHLAACGCKDVAFITEFPGWPLMRLRGQAFVNSARDAGHRVSSYVVGSDGTAEVYRPRVQMATTLEELVDKLVARSPRPTGIFSSTDRLTLKLYPLLERRGMFPGRDINVVSCDNQEAMLSLLRPRPASVDLRPDTIGQLAVARLIHRLQFPEEAALQIQVPPALGVGTDTPMTKDARSGV